MDNVMDFLKGFNVQIIISVFFMLWYFSHHMEQKFERQSQRTDKLYEMFIELLKDRKSNG